MQFKKILIGIDDSQHAAHAAKCGFELARLLNAEVALAHVIEPIILPDNEIGLAYPLDMVDAQNEASEHVLNQTIEKFASGEVVKRYLEIGRPTDMIIEFAKEFQANVIVIGTHSRKGLDRMLMGSVAEHIMRNSPIPVLVIPLPSSEKKDPNKASGIL